MSKNNAFNNKGKQTEVIDPVAAAQAEQMATYKSAPEDETTKNPETQVVNESLESSLSTVNTVSAGDSKEPAVVTQETAAPVVVEVNKSREITQSNILKGGKAAVSQGLVLRPTGASARETSPPSSTAKVHVASNEFRARMASEAKSGTANAVSLIGFLDTYVVTMAPRKITPTADILRMQEGLLDNLNNVINRAPAKEFNRLWNIAIQYVDEYKTACFSPLYFSRGARDWKRDPQQFQLLSSLINLLLATARDKTTVNEVVNLEAVVGQGFSEEARGRVFNFYS